MARPLQQLLRFFRELKRRNVYKVAVAYLAVAFVGLQAAQLLVPATTLPPWADDLVIYVAVFGFPLALVIAWAFEMTPEGVRRTREPEPVEEGASEAGEGRTRPSQVAVKAFVGLGVVAAAVAGGWYLTGSSGSSPSELEVGERSVAVLPFDALSTGEESQTFARGIHDDLLIRLAHISSLTVLSRQAVEKYRDAELTVGAIADSLGVRWVVQGGVQKLEDQIQVNAQLVDPRTEAQRWADSYRRDLTAEGLFALQSEITKSIAQSLEAELTPEETRQVERQPTGDLDAYRLYVKGRDRLETRTEAGMRDAVDYFRRAIEQDSTYALAWSGLADAIGLFDSKEYATPEHSLPDHGRIVGRALELGPDLAEARASMGFYQILSHDGGKAVHHLERAVKVKPGYAQAHHWLGYARVNLGHLAEAREHLLLAVELNPENAAARETLIQTWLARGDTDAARNQLDRFPLDYQGAADERTVVLYQEERWDDLRPFSRRLLTEGVTPASRWHFYLARIAILNEDTALARQHLRDIRQHPATNASRFAEGLVHAALGDADSAFEDWLSLDFEGWVMGEGDENKILRYYYSDILDPLREDPRYRALIRRLNVGWGLDPDGSLPDSVGVSFETQSIR